MVFNNNRPLSSSAPTHSVAQTKSSSWKPGVKPETTENTEPKQKMMGVKRSQSLPLLSSETMVSTMNHKIDITPPQQMQESSEQTPVPTSLKQELQEAAQQFTTRAKGREMPTSTLPTGLKGELAKARQDFENRSIVTDGENESYAPTTETQVKDGRQRVFDTLKSDSQVLGQNKDQLQGKLNLNILKSDTVSQLSKTYSQIVVQNNAKANSQIKAALNNAFDKFLDKLHTADQSSPESKDQALKDVIDNFGEALEDAISNLGADDQLAIVLKSRNPNELRTVFSELVGKLRQGKSKTYDQLSQRKKDFVDTAVEKAISGLKGINKSGVTVSGVDSPLVPAQTRLRDGVQNEVRQMKPQQLRQLLSLSPDDLRRELINTFGHSPALIDSLMLTVRDTAVETLQVMPMPGRTVEPVVKPFDKQGLLTLEAQYEQKKLNKKPNSLERQQEFMKAVGQKIRQLPTQDNSIWHLTTRTDQELKNLLKEFAPQVPDKDLDRMVDELRTQLPISNDRLIQVKGDRKTFDVPETMHVTDQKYKMERYITQAGNGAVFAYVNVNDPNDKLAVKLNMASDRDEVMHEINMHREMQGLTGSDKVVDLKGAVTLPDGNILMVQEYVGGGDLLDAHRNLLVSSQQGTLSDQSRQLIGLAILKQTMEAVKYSTQERQMLHLDLKVENMMVGNDGKVKLIDFGTSRTGTTQLRGHEKVDAVSTRAPERMFVQGNTVIDENVDTWGVGLIAYQLLNGPIKDLKLYGDKFSFMSERKVEAFGSDGDSRMLTSSVQTDGTQGIGISSTDKLINSLLMPDPTQRVSLEDALKTSLFQDERLDSPEMSNLLKKFSTLPRLPEDSPDQERAEAFAQHIEPELRQLGLL